METKPFWLSSEFYITVGTITAALAGAFPVGGKIATVVVAVSGAAYAISRGLAKSGTKPTK
jgi:hypothetical protein